MATLLPRQNVISTAMDVKSTFSSWDGCMSKTYCKWPVIIAIIVGSLIVISILWCFMRCLCCGKDLVCCCCRCCGSSRPQGAKHLDSVPPTPYNNQYASHPPPVYAGAGAFSQTATFEGKVHEDSLPAMPSWDTATSRKVEIQEEAEAHEMERLGNNSSPGNIGSGTISPPARPIPMRNGSAQSSMPGSPRLPGYTAPLGSASSPYGRGDAGGVGGGYGMSPSSSPVVGPYGRGGDTGGAYGSKSDLHGSRSNLVQDGYGGGYRGAAASQSQSYGVDRYNNNTGGYSDDHNSPYGGSGGNGGGYTRPSRSPVNTTHAATSNYDYASSNTNYDRYGSGSGYGNTGTGNTSNSRPGQYPGQSTYGNGGRGGASSGWRDL